MSPESTDPGIGRPAYLETGSVLKGRYEIIREIGRGGYSVVYAARDRELDTNVAIKLLAPPPADALIARERMRREVQAARGLSHSNIVAVHDLLEEGPWTFIVMELVDGPDLGGHVRERGPMDSDRAARLGEAIAEALTVAHRRGILHRDVKPQNILLGADDRARLTDFGSARLEGQATVTRTGGLVGTLHYAAPELLAGHRGDARSDIYALGLTLYLALTGGLPERPSPHLPPPPAADGYHPREARPDVAGWLDAVIARATAAEPGHRFPTSTALAEALRRRGEGRLAVSGAEPALRESCVICGAPEPLGLGVCPRCGGISAAGADTLVFIERSASIEEREAVADRLKDLLAGRVPTGASADAALGYRALVQLPAPAAASVVEQLRLRKIRARAVRAGRAWAPLPVRFYAFLALVAGVGSAAGSAVPPLALTSPLVAVLLLLTAQRRLQTPLLKPPRRTTNIPMEVEKSVVAALARLPDGTARHLLADLVGLAGPLFAALSRTGDSEKIADDLAHLLVSSCDVALGLADLDDGLARIDAQRERFPDDSDGWIDILSRAERSRDRLVQKLLEALTLLARARSNSAAILAAGDPEIPEITREIERHFEAHAGAARELRRLLGEATETEDQSRSPSDA